MRIASASNTSPLRCLHKEEVYTDALADPVRSLFSCTDGPDSGAALCKRARTKARAVSSVPMAGPAAAISAHFREDSILSAVSAGVMVSSKVSSRASGSAVCTITRLASWVNILTIPAPALIQARAAKRAAPHILRRPAMIRTLPKVPLLPPGSLAGSRHEGLASRIVNMPGTAGKASSVIPI